MISLPEKALRSKVPAVDRQERQLGTDPAGLDSRLADIVDRLLHDIDRPDELVSDSDTQNGSFSF